MKITIVDNDKRSREIDVDAELVYEATIIQYKSRYYAYSSTSGALAFRPKFVECRPPVKIE